MLPINIVKEFTGKLNALSKKYEITFAQVDAEIAETEKALVSMIDELTGSEFDMQGLEELKKLLGGCAE